MSRFALNKYKTAVLLLVVLPVYVIGSDIMWSAHKKNFMGGTLGADLSAHNLLAYTLKDLYKSEGLLFENIEEFERTDFFPFNKSLSPTPHGGILKADTSLERDGKHYEVSINGLPTTRSLLLMKNFDPNKDPYPLMPTVVEWSLTQSESEITKAKLRAYTMGVKKRHEKIEEIRNKFIRNLTDEDGYSALAVKISTDPPKFNFPQDAKTLRRYVEWLQFTQGGEKLIDGWGRELRFNLQNGRLVALSSGIDGSWGTSDDLIESK